MKIDLYARCWNEADMLPFFFLHYDKLVQRYIIYEDGSTDNSREILLLNPKVELRRMPYNDPDSRINSALALQETCWRESRGIADWVIVTDIDEHLYHPDMYRYLAQCHARGVTIIPALGYQMLSEQFPEHKTLLCQSLTRGACDPLYSKLNIFSPNEIDALNYAPGRHTAAPMGRVVTPTRDELLLLHYHYLGFERVRIRHAQFVTRQRKTDSAIGWGHEYSWSSEQLREVWNLIGSRLVDISRPDLRPWKTHQGPRWWTSAGPKVWKRHQLPPWWRYPFVRETKPKERLVTVLRDLTKEFVPPILLRALRRWLPARKAASHSPEEQELARLTALPPMQPTTTEIFGWPFYVPDARSFVALYNLYFKNRILDFSSRDSHPYIIDCGANIGVTVSWWKKRYPDAHVLAFEADPDNFRVLYRNCGTLPGVRLLNAAVWDQEGEIPFVAKGGEGGHIAELSNRPREEMIRSVPCVRLHSFLSHKCDFLKMDIEGAEVAVIRDCADALKNVARIFVEYHSFGEKKQSLGETISLLEKAGFRLHIHTELASSTPFNKLVLYNEKDLRLDLFGFRDDAKPRHDLVMVQTARYL